jgi:hypothetical protein
LLLACTFLFTSARAPSIDADAEREVTRAEIAETREKARKQTIHVHHTLSDTQAAAY